MERKWSVRAYKAGDEEGIFELWKEVYPEQNHEREQWLRWWRWKYRDNPAGAGWVAIADDAGRVVGHQAAIPVAMKIGAEVITCFQTTDAMSHPAYRGQGIYQAVNLESIFPRTAEDNVAIGYSFANEASHPIAVANLAYFDVAHVPDMFRPLDWANTLKTRISSRFLTGILATGSSAVSKIFYRSEAAPVVEGLVISQVFSFDERINEFWDRNSSQYPVMVVRNRDYLDWRYVAIPDVAYTIFLAEKEGDIHGYLVLRCLSIEGTRVGLIFDIMAQSGEVAQNLISRAVERCMEEAVDIIYCRIVANKTLLGAFSRNGFISTPFLKHGWFVVRSGSLEIPRELLMDSKNWLIQLGDSDML